jgi:hypothetical protein
MFSSEIAEIHEIRIATMKEGNVPKRSLNICIKNSKRG